MIDAMTGGFGSVVLQLHDVSQWNFHGSVHVKIDEDLQFHWENAKSRQPCCNLFVEESLDTQEHHVCRPSSL